MSDDKYELENKCKEATERLQLFADQFFKTHTFLKEFFPFGSFIIVEDHDTLRLDRYKVCKDFEDYDPDLAHRMVFGNILVEVETGDRCWFSNFKSILSIKYPDGRIIYAGRVYESLKNSIDAIWNKPCLDAKKSELSKLEKQKKEIDEKIQSIEQDIRSINGGC
jgi:hypothetical protein